MTGGWSFEGSVAYLDLVLDSRKLQFDVLGEAVPRVAISKVTGTGLEFKTDHIGIRSIPEVAAVQGTWWTP